ncbi:MAG: carbonic anhydrase [Actinobacteria bacterium]|nr:carbonic anhydrase [Actinomycetota bacterium]
MFEDLLAANERYAATFDLGHLTAPARKRFALVTCIDSRIEPMAMLALEVGDAKVLRNAGGRVNDDVLRSLILATNLLDVDRVAVMHHTDCAGASSQEALAARVGERLGTAPPDRDFQAIGDPDADLRADVEAVRSCPLVRDEVTVAGWRYDVATGRISEVC